MTCCYNSYFLVVWSSVALALPVGVGLVASSFVRLWTDDNASRLPAFGLFCLGLLPLLWTAYMRRHAPRLKVRAGAWPSLGCGDAYPRNARELEAAVKAIREKYKRNPEIVGAAWGHFITRRGAAGPRIYTHRMLGRDRTANRLKEGQSKKEEYWHCGNTIRYMVQHFSHRDRTFSTHPTMDYISIGAWFAMGNHGNGGNHKSTKGSSDTLQSARVLNMNTQQTVYMNYKQLRQAFDTSPRDYCVISVAFNEDNLSHNSVVQKRGIVVNSIQSASDWLAKGAHLRVLFQGAARDYAIGLRWEGEYDEKLCQSHRDPHLCSRFCLYAQVDLCSVWGGWHESMHKFRGCSTHADANRWMPLLFPIETVFTVAMGYYNFEIIFKLNTALNGLVLFQLTRSLIRMHEAHGGRSEIRYGAEDKDEPIFLDVVLRRSADFSAPFRMLAHEFEVTQVALHPGKYRPASTAPCKRVTLYEMYYDQS
jgi:hypothetical protein